MNCVENGVELVAVVTLAYLCGQFIQLHQRPLVQIGQVSISDCIGLGIEISEVAQNIAGRVADLQIVLREMLEHILGDTHILTVVRRGNPQAHNISAVLFENVLRGNAVAERLGHLLALLINDHAMRNDRLIRRLALRCDRGQHRGLEPAAILVIAFQIYVDRSLLTLTVFNDCAPGRTGVEPYVHGIGFLVEIGAAALALDAFRQDLSSGHIEPCVGTRSATALMVCSLTSGLPHFLQVKIGIGTPQTRWREMHQSERSRIMEVIRS